jgi:hypothetical protein
LKNKVVSVLHCAVVFGLCLWLIFPLLFLHSNIFRVLILLEKEGQRVVDRMMLKRGALSFLIFTSHLHTSDGSSQ